MTPTLFGEDGRPIPLLNRIGKGGEGEVYAIDGSDKALKYYTVHDGHDREQKIRLMISHQLATKSPLVAFPISLVFDKARRFVGFTMTKVSQHQPLHELYSPGARKASFPQANYRFLVMSAGNVARAIAMAHANACVIGDINHSGILVSPKATVALIDADSFQVTDGSRYFNCKVGVPEYTPPELQGKALGAIVRTANHDAFGLAIVIFQLLFMGRHPYSGSYAKGEMPLEKAIAEHRFAYSLKRSVGMVPPPDVPTLRDFPSAIGNAFESAFSADGINARPSATQWIALLEELRANLRVCARSPLHHYPAAAPNCPWCRMERRYSVPLFVPAITQFSPSATFTPTIGDVLTIWRAIEAVAPPASRAFPSFPAFSCAPSEKAGEMKRSRLRRRWIGWTMIGAAVGTVAGDQSYFLLCIIPGGIGWWLLKSKAKGDEEIIKTYKAVQTRVSQAEAEWDKQNSGIEFLQLKSELMKKKTAYEALPQEQKRRLDDYANNRRLIQLNAYLSGLQIRNFEIPKIGQGRRAVLLSYGIETAADVSEHRILRVPGFGPKTTQPLLNWRRHMEARFVFSSAPTPADNAALSAIRSEVAQRAASLKSELSVGPAKLAQLNAATASRQAASIPFLEKLSKQRAQAAADLEAIELKTPEFPKPASTPEYAKRLLPGLIVLAALSLAWYISSTQTRPVTVADTMPAVQSQPPVATQRVSPSFDCERVQSDVLKLVCATPSLALADQKLASAYAQARAVSPDPNALRDQQRVWIRLRNNSDPNVDALQTLYTDRIAALTDAARPSTPAHPPTSGSPIANELQSTGQKTEPAIPPEATSIAVPQSTSQNTDGGNQGDYNSDATSVVADFYRALEISDGTKAASFIVPEKTIAGPLSSEAMTKFYSSLREPLRLQDVRSDADGSVLARYSYVYQNGKECRGTARLLLTKRGNTLLIDRILANQQCT